jgi:hypothetical protein
MTTAAEMRSAIMTSLADLEIGRLHSYERYSQNQGPLKKLYQAEEGETEGRINGWNLRRGGFKKNIIGTQVFYVRTVWVLTGYLSLEDKDKTELLLDTQVDLVSKALTRDITFGLGNWLDDYEQDMEAQPVMFCGVLCHQAVITFPTEHEQSADDMDALEDFLTFSAQYDIPPHVTATEHAKWLKEPPDHSASKPELSTQTQIRED